MRRSVVTRSIAAWDFGHPHMGGGFGQIFGSKPDSSCIVESAVERSTLANGVTVITHDKGTVNSTVGIFADAGSKYDPASAPGLAFVMRSALFGGNMHNSMFQIDRAYRSIGAAYGHTDVNKRWIGAWASANRIHFRNLVDELAPAFAAPRFAEPDVERLRDNFDAQREEMRWNVPRQYAVDELERVAFYKEPLGAARMVPPETNGMCSSAALLEKYASCFRPSRVTVVGVNVGHQELVAAYETQAFALSADAPHFQRANALALDGAANEAAQFYPGKQKLEFENRAAAMMTKPDLDQEGIAALGWLTFGADSSVEEYAAGLVYRELVACNINEALANPSGERPAHGLASFYRPYSSAGLVGVTARASPNALPDMVVEASKALPSDLATNLPAAKARALVSFYNAHADSLQDYAAFLATSKWSMEEIAVAIEHISSNGVARANDLARAGKPAMFATGDVMNLPTIKKL